MIKSNSFVSAAPQSTMETTKAEYDTRLGGPVQLPETVATYRYSADRITEIKSLLGAIRHPNQTKLVFQNLPKHMRRRAMSHNPKRLPRRHRTAHLAQMRKSGGTTATPKRPSRKYRRKASNLNAEYARRQRRHRWLETHLWHAKRFHMIERWGYRLASSSCDKTFRSSYRATAEHCLLQDVSYVGAVELSGPLGELRRGLARVSANGGGTLGPCARTFVHGGREALVELFAADAFPFGAIGRVKCIWRPIEEVDGVEEPSESTVRTAWMFAHPTIYADVVRLLRDVFDARAAEVLDGDEVASVKPPSFANSSTNVHIVELRDRLNRFRLTGPLANAVLAKAFRPQRAPTDDDAGNWFAESLLKSSRTRQAHQSQTDFWHSIRTIRSATELTPNMVLALNIEDPRLNRPQKRTKAQPDDGGVLRDITQPYSGTAAGGQPRWSNHSALWSQTLRDRVTSEKMTTSEYCKQRNRHVLVPGARCLFEEQMQPVPVLLVQRPGCEDGREKRLGYGGGWDVILPAGYGVVAWMCLIMWGAKAGGLREVETVWRERGRDEFVPDTRAAEVMAVETEEKLKEV